jgi:hypothetical protein
MPLAAAGVVAFVLAALLTAEFGKRDAGAGGALAERQNVERIAHRVEAIRGLRFKTIPEVRIMSEEEIGREQEQQATGFSAKEKATMARADREARASIDVAKVLGLLPEGFNPNTAGQGSGAPSDLLGIYDPRANNVRMVDKAVKQDPKLAEAALAHELDHALEAQRFGAHLDTTMSLSERSLAFMALQEGVATVVEAQYAKRHLGAHVTLREMLGRSNFVGDARDIPTFLEDSMAFPYRQGGLFADSLLREAGGNDFRRINEAQRRPPVSSAQILEPDLWRKNVVPVAIPVDMKTALGAGWKRRGGLDFGEFDTTSLMRLGGTRNQGGTAAAGWAGGRYEIWTNAPGHCDAPCRDRTALLVAWRWRSPGNAAQQEALVEPYVQRALKPTAGHDRAWHLTGGWVAFSRSGKATALGFAPTRELASRVASEGL